MLLHQERNIRSAKILPTLFIKLTNKYYIVKTLDKPCLISYNIHNMIAMHIWMGIWTR